MREDELTLFCLDIGNTSTGFGVYRNGKFVKTGHARSDRFPSIMDKMIRNMSNDPTIHIIVSSVVPSPTLKIKKWLRGDVAGKRLFVVGGNCRVRIKHKYHNIDKLGSDRLVNAFGAMKIYGPPLLIFDYGTALTCDYISSRGAFEGGLIIPGPEIALKALSEKAALLPSIRFPKKAGFIGRDTRSGMEAGILQGYGALTDGLVERFGKRFGRKSRVIATGGLAALISRYSSKIDLVDPLLTLKSLVLVFKDRAKTS